LPIVSAIIPYSRLLYSVLSFVLFYLCFHLKETLGKEIPHDIPETSRRILFLSTGSRRVSKTYISLLSVNKDILSDPFLRLSDKNSRNN